MRSRSRSKILLTSLVWKCSLCKPPGPHWNGQCGRYSLILNVLNAVLGVLRKIEYTMSSIYKISCWTVSSMASPRPISSPFPAVPGLSPAPWPWHILQRHLVSLPLFLVHILVGCFGSVPTWIPIAAYSMAVNEQKPCAVAGSKLGKDRHCGKRL